MPAAETTGGRPSAKLLQILFWAGVGLAPLAALLLLFGGGFVLQLAAVLAVLVVVLIGLSIALRPDNDNVRSEIEEAMFEELDTLRDDIRGDITHAARATHGQLVERIGVLHETVDALRNQVDMMRGQLERAARAAQQAAAQHAGPQPAGSAAVPQGVLRHTETVQVTTKTMVVDPTDQRRDGTVYGARPEIPQQRRPASERGAERDADWPSAPATGPTATRRTGTRPRSAPAMTAAGRGVVDAGHWSEAPDRAAPAGPAGPTAATIPTRRSAGGRSGSHDRGRARDTPDWVDQSDRTATPPGMLLGTPRGLLRGLRWGTTRLPVARSTDARLRPGRPWGPWRLDRPRRRRRARGPRRVGRRRPGGPRRRAPATPAAARGDWGSGARRTAAHVTAPVGGGFRREGGDGVDGRGDGGRRRREPSGPTVATATAAGASPPTGPNGAAATHGPGCGTGSRR